MESYWTQAEIASGADCFQSLVENGATLPPLRFAAKFTNVNDYFSSQNGSSVMASDPINCANVHYRLLLSAEKNRPDEEPKLKALFQNRKGKGPKVAYSIYVFDKRACPDSYALHHLLRPVTKCGLDGEGFANEIIPSSVKTEFSKDELWLSVTINFLSANITN